MNIKSAEFVTSCTSFADVVRQKIAPLPQFAFVGRSNVGKSSLINMLCNRKNMAITSSTPGRTRLINFFEIAASALPPRNDVAKFYFVDLPGYGYAAASKSAKDGWNDNIGEYLMKERNLKMIFVLLDIRVKPSDKDVMALHFLQQNNVPFKIIATKIDKISKSQVHAAVSKLSQELGVGRDDIIVSSSSDKRGRLEILSIVNNMTMGGN